MSFMSYFTSGAAKAFKFATSEGVLSAFASGAAVGAANYMTQKSQQRHDDKLYNRRLMDEDARAGASSLSAKEYNSHVSNLTGGLLTQGQLTQLPKSKGV